jgi:hypothetical protein
MAPRPLRFVPPLLAFVFAILALVFSLLAITSKAWAVRNNYNPLYPPKAQTSPIYTLYRSPFIVCGASKVVPSSSVSSASPAAAAMSSSSNPTPTATYDVTCTNYRPYGFNRTSCELQIATLSDNVPTVGDARLCQQIHYAGNFGITSTLFIGLGFLLTGMLLVMTFLRTQKATKNYHESALQEATEVKEAKATTHASASEGSHRPSHLASYLSFCLLLFFFIGFVTGILSQFYGVLGFMEDLPNQSDYASSTGSGASRETNIHGNHGPWYQGVGLSVYATCAWAFAAAAGTMASRIWRLPNWSMIA